MKQCQNCLCLLEGWDDFCDNCGEKVNEPTWTKQENQGGASGSASETQGDPSQENKASEEEYSKEDTSKGIEYSGLLTDWVLAFREWHIDDNKLSSPIQSFEYGGGVLKADWMNESEGGFYGYHPSYLGEDFKPHVSHRRQWSIWGAIACKGDIYVYHDGLRAQYCKVILLSFDTEWRYSDVIAYQAWARKLYKCRAVRWETLKYNALKLASPVPISLIPKEEPEEC